jgi:hypothetical protein
MTFVSSGEHRQTPIPADLASESLAWRISNMFRTAGSSLDRSALIAAGVLHGAAAAGFLVLCAGEAREDDALVSPGGLGALTACFAWLVQCVGVLLELRRLPRGMAGLSQDVPRGDRPTDGALEQLRGHYQSPSERPAASEAPSSFA